MKREAYRPQDDGPSQHDRGGNRNQWVEFVPDARVHPDGESGRGVRGKEQRDHGLVKREEPRKHSAGEDRRGDPLGEAGAAAKAGVHVYVIGVGTPEGGPIPSRDAGGTLTGYMKDKKAETVVTRLAEGALIRLAAAAQGASYAFTATSRIS